MASKSKRRRKVLGASCILAALIIAGSSFAWFTSKDEVTNRLTATADYGVSIAENFTPPENFLPGQKVNKDVGVVNTGNVDAIVRTWLEGEMDVMAEKRDKTTWDATNGKFTDQTTTATDVLFNSGANAAVYTKAASSDDDEVTGLTKVTDDKLNALGLTYSYVDGSSSTSPENKVFLKELDTTIYANPNSPTTAQNNPDYFNEVMSVQAGGTLAYLKTGAANNDKLFIYTPNNSTTFKNSAKNAQQINGGTKYNVVLNSGATDDITVDNAANPGTITVRSEDDVIKYLGEYIDTDNFYPAATGLFIFRRNSDKDATSNDPTVSDYEFSGYYYVKSGTETGYNTDAATTFGEQGKYFALQYENDNTQRSDYVLEKDTYTVIRDDDGNVQFVPSCKTDGTYYQVGSNYYNANGVILSGTDASTAATALSAATEKTVTLFTAQEKVYQQDELVWKFYANTALHNGKAYYKDGTDWYPIGAEKIDANKVPAGDIKSALDGVSTLQPMYLVQDKTNSGLKIDIQLADTILGAGSTLSGQTSADASHAETWTRKEKSTPDGKDTFYYNNDVEEGATTARLVDSVSLDGSVTQNDFIAFDFDLNVKMESVQVTIDNDGKETADTANAEFKAGDAPVKITGVAKGSSDTEIDYLTWS